MQYVNNNDGIGFSPLPFDEQKSIAREKLRLLTRRELEILHFIVAGEQNKVIAHKLGISQRTVENHRNRIIEKTGCKSQASLTCLFILTMKECLIYCSMTRRCNHTYEGCPIEHKLLNQ